jgi:phage gpG-like protein
MIPKITANLRGDVRAVTRITHVKDNMRDAVRNRVVTITERLFGRVYANLAGGVLQVRTGALLSGLAILFSESGTAVTGQVVVKGVSYADIQERGGQTAAHIIMPRTATVLAFAIGGETLRFARVVHHPGSNIKASNYMTLALEDEGRSNIIAEITATVREVINDS